VYGDFAIQQSTTQTGSSYSPLLYINATGNVGIGTSSPSYLLSVQNASADTNTFVGQSSSTGMFTQWRYNATTANAYGEISTYGGNNPIYIQGQSGGGNTILNLLSGNVGIGTSSPSYSLDIVNSSSNQIKLGSSSTSNYVIGRNTGTGYLSFYGNQTGYTGYVFGGIDGEKMRLDASGNLGLGVTPSAWSGQTALQLSLGSVSSGSGELELQYNTYYNGGFKYVTSAGATQYSQNGSSHRWFTAPSGTAGNPISFTQALTLDNSGNLLVGTTSAGLTNTNSITIQPTYNTNGDIVINHASGSASGQNYIIFGYNASGIGSITQNGTTGVLYNISSDARLKTNIVDAPQGNIDQIKVRSFDWIADGSHQEYGMVAQELLEVAPYAVHQPQDPDEMMGVDYSKLVPMMIKEIQDLKKEIALLKAKQ